MPIFVHNDRITVNGFLRWLALKSSGLSNEMPLNKNQLQELLLGIALFLRDLEYSCFVDHEEISVPSYIINGCLQPTDLEPIADVVDTLIRVVRDQLK